MKDEMNVQYQKPIGMLSSLTKVMRNINTNCS